MSGRDLAAWLRHIESVHFRSIDLSLDRVRRVYHSLKLRLNCRIVIVAGTNGKGSTVSYLESIYTTQGYRTGAYTSPHLVSYNERIRVAGESVDDAQLLETFERIEQVRGDIPLTYFEFGTLAALVILDNQQVDIALLEIGMGGRLDAVNIVDPDVSVVTEIGLDHQAWLGHDRETIAREKAGVMRYGGHVVSSGIRPPANLAGLASTRHANLLQLGEQFGWEATSQSWIFTSADPLATEISGLPLPREGSHQLNNAAGALMVVHLLQQSLPVDTQSMTVGIKQAIRPGRLQLLQEQPPVILDVSHNPDGIEILAGYLEREPVAGRNIAVFSMLEDKDIDDVVRLIGQHFDGWFIAPLDNPRAASTDLLSRCISRHSQATVRQCPSIATAADRAIAEAQSQDRVVAFGSFYAAGDILQRFGIVPYRSS